MRAAVPVVLVLIGLLCACGGGGGGDGDDGGSSSGPTLTVRGTVTYTGYPLDATDGIVYDSPETRSVRGAVVVAMKGSTVSARGNTAADGSYALSGVPASSDVRLIVEAALGDPAAPDCQVVDNTAGQAVWSGYVDITTPAASVGSTTADVHMPSGWDASAGAYDDAARLAGPFAILDAVYRARQLVRDVDPDVAFPPLYLNWSPLNRSESGVISLGAIGTSYYDGGQNIYILGAADDDTDEYDSHVIAHEWTHYLEFQFARSDSPGGYHAFGDLLDEPLAYSEGLANAVSAMIMGSKDYIDTNGSGQADTGVVLDLEEDRIGDTFVEPASGRRYDGAWSEASVQEVVYDLYDGGTGDDDGLSLGFKPLYDTLVGGQKTTTAFTTIYSFLDHLKVDRPGDASAIGTLATAENIGAHDAFDETNWPRYRTVPVDGTIVTTDARGESLSTWAIFGSLGSRPSANRLYDRQYFVATATAAGSHVLEIDPDGDALIELEHPGVSGYWVNRVGSSLQRTYVLSVGQQLVFTVGSSTGPVPFTVTITSASGTQAPSGNG